MRKILLAAALLLFTALQPVLATQPLVDARWLIENLNEPELRIIDLQPAAGYQRMHIPGAVNSDYRHWREKNSQGTPSMLPDVAKLEQLIGSLGIDNNSHVILVATGRGAGDMAMATRVFWSLKAVGHDEVSILDGGVIAYAQNRQNPLEQKINQPQPRRFKARLRPELIATAGEVQQAIASSASLIDNRSSGEYRGVYGPGTIPSSTNLPYDTLMEDNSGRFLQPEELKKIYQQLQLPTSGDQIIFCQSGHRASLGWFVSYALLGNEKASLYDGSMVEWSANPGLPVEAGR